MDARQPQPRTSHSFASHLQDYLRWLAFLLLVTAVAGLLLLYLVQTHLDEQIRAHIESKFRSHYSDLLVNLRSARRLPQGGIEVRGLAILEPVEGADPKLMAYIDEMYIDCDTGLEDLLSADRQVRQLLVRRLLIRATHRADGGWSVADSMPLPKFGEHPPPARIESAVIELDDQTCTTGERWVLRQLDMQVTPQLRRDADGILAQTLLHIRGQLSSEQFASVDFGGTMDPTSGRWEFAGSLKQLEVSPEGVDRLPPCFRPQLEPLRSLRGTADIDFQVRSAEDPGSAPVAVAAGWFHGSVEDQRLPHRLRDVHITFRCDPSGLHLDRLSARTDDTLLVGTGFRAGWSHDSRLGMQLRVEQFVLDNSLRANLQGQWREVWERFSPAGVVDADIRLTFDGRRWQHRIVVDCRDVSFAYEKFPYRVTNTQGRIRCDNGHVRLENLRALASRRVVDLAGEFQIAEGRPIGWLEVSAEDPIPIDERLIAALPEKGRRVVRDLQPHGMVSVWGRYEMPADGSAVSKQLQIGLHNCAVRYAKFEYPIHRIEGRLTMQNDHWTFDDLRGLNDSGILACRGTWQPAEEEGSQLYLEFDARDVPLEDELRDALKPEVQVFWNKLRPRGSIDQLQIRVDYASHERRLDISVEAHKMPAGQNVAGRSITVHPTFLPYQLDHVIGSVRYANGQIELVNLRGEHGETSVKLNGKVDTPPDGTWRVALSEVTIDQLEADHELARALPPAVGHGIRKLNLSGPVAINGWLELSGIRGETAPRASRWQLAFDIENGSIHCGLPVEHVHGGVTLEGELGPQGLQGRGWIQVDSMMYKGIQLTQVEGPLIYDRERIRIGQWTDAGGPAQDPQPLRARDLGGVATATAQVWFQDVRFEVDATLNEGDLAIISREATSQRHSISGRTFASVRLYGSGKGMHTVRGQGQIQLREADIYELPVMIRLLKLLRIQTPDDTAFTSSDVAFRMEADRIYFDRIDFDGDAISLEGRGEMNLDRVLNLTFDTFVGRDDDQPLSLLVRPLLKEAGRRLMVTRVTGTLEDPHVERIALPDVNEGFQQVFPTTSVPRDRSSR